MARRSRSGCPVTGPPTTKAFCMVSAYPLLPDPSLLATCGRQAGGAIASARPLGSTLLDETGVLATEHDAALRMAGCRAIADHALPLRLGSAAQGQRLAATAAWSVQQLQRAVADRETPDHGIQLRTLYGRTAARFRVPTDPAPLLVRGPFQLAADWRAIVRFSHWAAQSDANSVPDQRAVGVRILDAGRVQNLGFASGAAGDGARDARQFLSTMQAVGDGTMGGLRGRFLAMSGLLCREGGRVTLHLARGGRTLIDIEASLALSCSSPSPIRMDEKFAHLALHPAAPPCARARGRGMKRPGRLQPRVHAAPRLPGSVLLPCRPQGADAQGSEPTAPGAWIILGGIALPRQDARNVGMLKVAAGVHAKMVMHPLRSLGRAQPAGKERTR